MINFKNLNKSKIYAKAIPIITKYTQKFTNIVNYNNQYYIGYWTNVTDKLKDYQYLSVNEYCAIELLKKDLDNLLLKIDPIITVELNEDQVAAILSFTHNLGINNLKTSTLLKTINQKKDYEASQEFLKWINVSGKPSEVLIRRRKEESLLFVSNIILNTTDSILNRVIAIMNKHNYVIYTQPYKPNIVGIRSSERKADKFDDKLVVFYKTDKNNEWVFDEYKITTDPGGKVLKQPINSNGTAIICAGQYIDSYAYGYHKGYRALVQVKNIKFYRDNNRNDIIEVELDENNINPLNFKIFNDIAGLNIHHASAIVEETQTVNDWSAGCQVFSRIKEWNKFIEFIDKYNKLPYNKWYTYTLINSKDKEFKILY